MTYLKIGDITKLSYAKNVCTLLVIDRLLADLFKELVRNMSICLNGQTSLWWFVKSKQILPVQLVNKSNIQYKTNVACS